MTNTNNLLTQVECLVNNNMSELVTGTSLSNLDIRFILKPVLFNHDKRGHMVSSALLNSILEHNKASSASKNNLINSYKEINIVTQKLNGLLEKGNKGGEHDVIEKLSHFTQKDGVISVYLQSDLNAVEDFIEYTKDLVNSDEESSEKATDDAEYNHEENQESEADEVGEGESHENGCNDISESIFKEIRITTTSQNSEFADGNSAVCIPAPKLANVSPGNQMLLKIKKLSENSKIKPKAVTIHTTLNSSKSNEDLLDRNNQDFMIPLEEDTAAYSHESETGVPLDTTNQIVYGESVMNQLQAVIDQNKLPAYNTVDELKAAIEQVLKIETECFETQTPTLDKTIFVKGLNHLMVLYTKNNDEIKVFKTVW
jgi:hypothetical protein